MRSFIYALLLVAILVSLSATTRGAPSQRKKHAPVRQQPLQLPRINWPFSKLGDPGVTLGYKSFEINDVWHGHLIIIEPILMKNGQCVYRYGCDLSVRVIPNLEFGYDPKIDPPPIDYGHLPIGGDDKDPKALQLFIAPDTAARLSIGIEPSQFDPKEEDGTIRLNPPKTYGISFSIDTAPFSLAYNIQSYVACLGKNAQIAEYPLFYLANCTFPDGRVAIKQEDLERIIKQTPLRTSVNNPQVGFDSMKKRLVALTEFLNASMLNWAKTPYTLRDLRLPQDDIQRTQPTDVFDQIPLPDHEIELVNRYYPIEKAKKLTGQERLTLRMTINRILLDRILLTGWILDKAPDPENGQVRWKNNGLQQAENLLVQQYGMMATGLDQMGSVIGHLSTIAPTPVSNLTVQKMVIEKQKESQVR